jgi:hypothetical protein
MKMDQQTLKKHHFWILLGLFGLFALLLIILVPVLIGAEIDEKTAAIAKVEKDLKDASSSPMTQAFIDEETKQISTLSDRRERIWRDMYSRQGGILSFPTELSNKLDSTNFGGEIDDRLRDRYRTDDVYRAAYLQMASIIAPTEFAGGSAEVLHPVAWTNKLPSSEEVWLSLEDLCIRREVLKILEVANTTASRFEPVVGAKDLPTSNMGPKFSKRWKNRENELDLVITDKGRNKYSVGGKLRNLSDHRQSGGVFQIDVRLTRNLAENEQAKPTSITFPIDPLPAGKETTLKEIELPLNSTPDDIFAVDVHHSIRTVPIKRLVELVLSQNAGHRMADRKLMMTKFSDKAEADAAGSAAGTSGGSAGGTAGSAAGGGLSQFSGAGTGTGGGSTSFSGSSSKGGVTPNGIARARYIDRTDQVRRVPVAIVMVIDQSYTQDLLAAFSNSSQLRFQITQYHWQRFNGPIGTESESKQTKNDDSGGRTGGNGIPPGLGNFGGMGNGAGGGPTGPTGPSSGQGSAHKVAEPPPANLIQITIYGIANLYEKPANENAAGAEASAATPTTNVTTKPAQGEAPTNPSKPAEAVKPANGDSAKPASLPKATESGKPAATTPGKPVDSAAPKPQESAPPAKTNKPQTTESGKPKDGSSDKPKP